MQLVIWFSLLYSFRFLVSGDSVVLLFSPDDAIQSCPDLHEILVSKDVGLILSSHGVAPLFQAKDSAGPNLFKTPASVVFVSSDR